MDLGSSNKTFTSLSLSQGLMSGPCLGALLENWRPSTQEGLNKCILLSSFFVLLLVETYNLNKSKRVQTRVHCKYLA